MVDTPATPTVAMATLKGTPDTIPPVAVVRDRALLIEMSGADAGRVHRLQDEPTTVGRGSSCTLVFPDATLSREHARFVRSGTDWVIEDAGSLNGTFVNHERTMRCVLRHGDRIRLGSGVRFQFQLVSADEERVLVRLYEASVKDGLTGLFNRRHLAERLDSETAYAARHGTGLCLLILDIDHFKRVNDTHGHLAGDEVLRQTACVIQGQVRREDLVARYGGEEFVVIARGIALASARVLAERLRSRVESMEIRYENAVIRPTISIGVACLEDCGTERTPTRLIACADEALYRAKTGGRNRVVAFSDPGPRA